MNRDKMTDEQKQCVDARDSSIVVSAAAGSGKTSVLVERVSEIICDKNNPVPADSIVVVTFTDAAAKEMRQRIKSEMQERLSKNPNDLYLQEQNYLISSAHISTIHSFCMDILKNEYQKFGLKAGFSLSNDAVNNYLMQNRAITEVIEEYYDASPEKIERLTSFFDSKGGERGLISTVFQLENKLEVLPFPNKWMQSQLDFYSLPDGEYKQVLLERILPYRKNELNLILKQIDAKIKHFRSYLAFEESKFCDKIKPIVEYYEEQLNLRKLIEISCRNIEEITLPDVISPPNLKNTGSAFKEEETAVKNAITADFKAFDTKLSELVGILDGAGFDKKTVYDILVDLFEIYSKYLKRYKEIKIEENVVTFNDLMRYTFDLLCDEDGNKTDFAKTLTERFSYIILDEFQDTDDLQDMIFRMISKNEQNIFIVGDTKQSIYRFRYANPNILISKKENAKPYSESDDKWKKIILTKNFRSRKSVIDFSNFVFEGIMKKQVGGIDYNEEERLTFGADYYPENKESFAEVCLLDKTKIKGNGDADENFEVKFVANRIRSLIDSKYMVFDGKNSMRPCTYKDFAVVLRRKNFGQAYVNELSHLGIPATYNESTGYYIKTEIATIINLLQIIDNPLRELETVAVLMSPMFMFTAEEVAEIRTDDRHKNFYLLLKESTNEKVVRFIKQIDEFREYKSSHCIESLIKKIYADTAFVSVVKTLDDGQQRAANLDTFLDKVRDYESRYAGSLDEFVRYIKRISERARSDKDLADLYSSSDNCVNIMTIHKSKGLEFPICIVADISSTYNYEDLKGQMLISSENGIGLRIRNAELLEYYPSLPYNILTAKEIDDMNGEEIRLLYVALTRAKEKLIVVNSIETKDFAKYDSSFDTDDIQRAQSDKDLMLMALSRNKSIFDAMESYADGALLSYDETEDGVRFRIVTSASYSDLQTQEKIEFKESADLDLASKIVAKVNTEYQNEPLTKLPSKVTVTELVHGKNVGMMIFPEPNFMSGGNLSGAQIGTLHHKYMQFADYNNDIAAEIERMTLDKKFTEIEARHLNIEKLQKVMNLSVIERIKNSKSVWREFEFMTEIDAKEYDVTLTKEFENEKISLQGVADCVFEENGELVLIDYKTDRVNDVNELAAKYKKQLELYTKPIEKALKMKVKEKIIVSISLGEEIEL